MTYFPTLRRDYIIWRLATAGDIRLADIVRVFGVDRSSASIDINALLAEQPTVARYDKSAKRYVAHRHVPPGRLAKLAEALEWS